MRKVGFIGAFDKTDFILYIAKMLTMVQKKVLVIDTTITQKAKYVVPAINPTVSYITEFEQIDIAVGFHDIVQVSEYLGFSKEEDIDYDYVLIDIDTEEYAELFDIYSGYKNYFVTSFDTYSIRRGLEVLRGLRAPLNLTKVIFSKEISKEDDDYLNYLSLGYKVIWNEYRIYFPLEMGDQTAIIENQRVAKIKFGNLTSQYRESLTYIAEELLGDINSTQLARILKSLDKGE